MEHEQLNLIHLPPLEEQHERFERFKDRLKAFPASQVGPINLDLRQVSIAGQRLLNTLQRPEVKGRVGALPDEVFSPDTVRDLEDLTVITWYLKVQGVTEETLNDSKALPPELLTKSLDVRGRVLSLVSYHLRTTPENIAIIDKIREGTGHVDLATDLEMLARLVNTHRGLVEQDRVNYRAEDALRATELAETIRAALADANSLDWAKWSAKAFAMFRLVYEEVRQVAQFACRDLDEAPEFPGLFKVARKQARKKKKSPAKAKAQKPKGKKGKKDKTKASKKPKSPGAKAPRPNNDEDKTRNPSKSSRSKAVGE